MRIMFFCSEYPPGGYGIGRYIEAMAAGLRARNHETFVVTARHPGEPEGQLLERGRIFRIYDMADVGSPALTDRVLALAQKYQVDVIEVAERLGEGAELLRRQHRPPVLVSCHYNDIVLRARYAQAWYRWQRLAIDIACWRDRARHRRERFSIEHADGLAAPSQWMIDALRDQGVRIPARCMVVPNAVSPVECWVNEEAAEPTLLLVARLDFGKGLLYLRTILRRVARQFPSVRVEVVGPDSYARFIGSVRAWTARHLREQRVRVAFLGALGPKDLDAAYRRAWVVLLPSRWDTAPTVLLEAMARAKPVVVSPFGGMAEKLPASAREVADPAQPEFATAVCRLLASSVLRQNTGEALRAHVHQYYHPVVTASRYEELAHQVMSGGGRS